MQEDCYVIQGIEGTILEFAATKPEGKYKWLNTVFHEKVILVFGNRATYARWFGKIVKMNLRDNLSISIRKFPKELAGLL